MIDSTRPWLYAAAGIHTYSTGMVLTYAEYQAILKACRKMGHMELDADVWKGTERVFCSAFARQGIKLYLFAKQGKIYTLRVQIEPAAVLGEKDAAALFYNPKDLKRMVKKADQMLSELEVPRSVKRMKIIRCDLTVNVVFSDQSVLLEYLRLMKKSLDIPRYTRTSFSENSKKVRNAKVANAHSFGVKCKSANFLVYDKISQMEMIGRIAQGACKNSILRFEVQLKRPALKQHLGRKAFKSHDSLLSAAIRRAPAMFQWYMKRLQPSCSCYLKYGKAVELAEQSKCRKKMKEWMLYLLRKTSDSASLTAAKRRLRDKFHLSDSQCRGVLKKFKKLGFSPITLRNNSCFDCLPYLPTAFD